MKSKKEELELALAKLEKMKLELKKETENDKCLDNKLQRVNGELEALRRAVLKLISERDELERTKDKRNSTNRYYAIAEHHNFTLQF